MKIRKCHVTNSSSSSFICDICGREESGWDMCLSEAYMFRCVNYHTFCTDEAIGKEEIIKLIFESNYHLKENNCRKDYTEEELKDLCLEDLVRFYSDGYYDVPECVCPICQFEKYTDSDMLRYLLKKYNLKVEDILRDWKLLFGTYDGLKNYLKTK